MANKKIRVLWTIKNSGNSVGLNTLKVFKGLISFPFVLRDATSLLKSKYTKDKVELHILLHSEFDCENPLNKALINTKVKLHILKGLRYIPPYKRSSNVKLKYYSPYNKKVKEFIKKIIKENNIDLIHTFCLANINEAIEIKKEMSIPIIAEFWGAEIYKVKSELGIPGGFRIVYCDYEDYFKRLLPNIDLFIPLTKWHSSFLYDFNYDFKDKVRVLYNGVNVKNFYPEKKIKFDEFKKNPDELIILSYKRTLKTIEAAKEILMKLPNIKFIILAEISDNEKKLLNQLKIKDKFNFIGRQPYHKLHKIINFADIVLHITWFEGCSNFVLESMACGIPVVGSNNCGIDEEIIDGKTGILVNRFDSKKIAKAVIRLAKNKNLRIEMGKNARKHIVKNFTDRKRSKGYLECYQKVLSNKN